MDDFLIVANNKEQLWDDLAAIREFLTEHLHLSLNPKTKIFPASQGVDFAGYRTFPQRILPRKRNIKAAKIRFKNLSWAYKRGRIGFEAVRPRVASFLGYTKHCQAKRTAESTLTWLVLRKGYA